MQIDPPSHEDDVKRGLGVALGSAEAGEDVDVAVGKVAIRNFTPEEDRVIARLAEAMAAEFTFMSGDFIIAASGVLDKMKVEVTSGAEGVVIVIFP